MKIKKGSSLTSSAVCSKQKAKSLKKPMKNSPARALGSSSTPVSLKKVETASRLSVTSENGVKSKAVNNGASTSSSGVGNAEVIVSKTEAEKLFEWLISPVSPKMFLEDIFEKMAYVIKKDNKDYFKHLFGCKELDSILRDKQLKYSEDINVTSYVNGVERTHNGDGRAYRAVIWCSYKKHGHSIQLRKPQALSKCIWELQSSLADYFGSFVGGNIYLTPPGKQGFAPHYHDTESFVLQLEGQKHWKVYYPKSEEQRLPRFASGKFFQENLGEKFFDVTLSPGDVLYFPRGFIHQANTNDEHSVHLTLSVYQRFAWGDLLEKLLPRALQNALGENIKYRETLPLGFQYYMGVEHIDKNDPKRDAFFLKVQSLTEGLSKYLCTDVAVDQVVKDVIHSSLPPVLTEDEKSRSIHGGGKYWKDNKVQNVVELHLDNKIRLLRKNAVRIVMEDNCVRLYHSFENTKTYKEVEPQYVDISFERICAVEMLLSTYPSYTRVRDLPLLTDEDKLSLVGLLYDKGLLLSESLLTSPQDE